MSTFDKRLYKSTAAVLDAIFALSSGDESSDDLEATSDDETGIFEDDACLK